MGAVFLLLLCGQVQAQTTFRFASAADTPEDPSPQDPAPEDMQSGYPHVRNTDGAVNYERTIEYRFAADGFLSPSGLLMPRSICSDLTRLSTFRDPPSTPVAGPCSSKSRFSARQVRIQFCGA